MNEIKDFVEQLLMQIGLSAELASVTRHVVLVIGAILLALKPNGMMWYSTNKCSGLPAR